MFSAVPAAARELLAKFNRAAVWQREVRVWDQPLSVPTADRILYAALHRIGWMGRFERRFFQTVLRPGMTVVDAGANIGLYAQFFAQLVGDAGGVFAFEPDPTLFQALSDGRELAGRENLYLFAAALGDQPGKQPLRRSAFNSGDNRLRPPGVASPSEPSDPEITVIRGDDLLTGTPPVDFIKIDVQGWELHALRGLSATIERSPGIQIYLEFWPEGLRAAGCEPAELIAFLEAHGLAVRRRRDGGWEPVASGAALEKEVPGHRYINLWAGKLL